MKAGLGCREPHDCLELPFFLIICFGSCVWLSLDRESNAVADSTSSKFYVGSDSQSLVVLFRPNA
jgi:hypothetical protein